MRVGAFEVSDDIPEMRDIIAIAMLRPWVDVGKVGTMALNKLERHLGARELGRLTRPGTFFDFTRERPEMSIHEGRRVLTVPNTVVHHARDKETERDYLFLHLLEPHAMGEDYTDAVVSLLKHFSVAEYCRIGGMFDSVPHTRPLLVTATLNDAQVELAKGLVSTRGSSYQGPTSIVNLITESLTESGVATASLMVHLPHYAQLEEDHLGASRLMEVLCAIYGLPRSLADTGRGEQQYEAIGRLIEEQSEAASHIRQLETYYDTNQDAGDKGEDVTISTDVEKFLREMSSRLEDVGDDE